MQKNLVIVESPAKAKTIETFLGKDFKVMSSFGHIRDLKKKDLSVDIEKNFTPVYEVPSDKKKLVQELKKEAKGAETIWLASDEDREGEAIAWHLSEVLDLKEKDTKRIVFHEITKEAILKAIENPRQLDMNLIDAQQARRVLDRLVGFELSPVLWKKVKPALSAGRVQSVAVRLIVEREREIQHFESESYFRVVLDFEIEDNQGAKTPLKAVLPQRLSTQEEAMDLMKRCLEGGFSIENIEKKPVKKYPAAPFTTSTLQQEAARKLGFSVAQTMALAQRLYESGKITYMRTDSVNLSSLAIGTTKEEILSWLGKEYLHTRQFNTKTKGAQEAHEAIRPTYISEHTIKATPQEVRLYELIWKRTIASQMSEAELERTTITIGMGKGSEKFVAEGEVLLFDGFLKVYIESKDDETEEETEGLLPNLTIGDRLHLISACSTEKFTQKPPRYTEASLVKKMEELGIGRPSTYAPTISTLQERKYVEKGDKQGSERSYTVIEILNQDISTSVKRENFGSEKGKLIPTDVGIVVNDFLIEYFPSVLDYNFTAKVENQFDDVAEGKANWTHLISDFYTRFHPIVEQTLNTKTELKVGERILGNDPVSGKVVSVKIGRYGPIVQMGSTEETEKPSFASLPKDLTMDGITLEEALKLFALPRSLGQFEGSEVTVGAGKFGPYIRHNNKYVSLPKEYAPLKVTLEEALVLIENKRKEEAKAIIQTFEQEPELEIINGRYGPYIAYKGSNYKIPKGEKPEELSLEKVMQIIQEAQANPPARRFSRKKKK